MNTQTQTNHPNNIHPKKIQAHPVETISSPAQPNFTKLPFELLENYFSPGDSQKEPQTDAPIQPPSQDAHQTLHDADQLAAVRKRILAIQSETQQARKMMDKAEEERHKAFSDLQDTWHPRQKEAFVEPQGKVTGFGAKRKKASTILPTLETKPTKGKG